MSERYKDIADDPTFENVHNYWLEAFQARQDKKVKDQLKEMELDPTFYEATDILSLHSLILQWYEARPVMKEYNLTGLHAEVGLVKEASEVLEAAQLFPETIGPELADIYIYLTTIADKHDINLYGEVLNKLRHNTDRFPTELMQGTGSDFPERYKQIKLDRKERTIYERR